MRGVTDKEQLEYASKRNRVILSRNIKHFITRREYYNKDIQHEGILVTRLSPSKGNDQETDEFHRQNNPAKMKNALDYLQNYK